MAAILASSAVLTNASHSAVHSRPDLKNILEQRIENLSSNVWYPLDQSDPNDSSLISRFWGNGGGRRWGNGGGRYRAWGNGGRPVRRWGNFPSPRVFLNGPRRGFANW